jgi:acetolactate synthase-1/2/3 large subunit
MSELKKCGFYDWMRRIDELRDTYPDADELECRGDSINPNKLMHEISRYAIASAGYAVDVGQHQMWAAQSLRLVKGQRFLTSGGMGAMGFALPAAIGMVFSGTKKPVTVIAGDGGFQVNIQELETVRRNRLPIKMIVINNHCLGMVKQFQDEFFKSRYPATRWGYSAPDFVKIAKAYDIEARSVGKNSEIDNALTWLWRDPSSPLLLEINIPARLNVFPKIRFGSFIGDMDPKKP